MRLLFAVPIIAGLLQASALAQSVADLAIVERARRAQLSERGRVITSEDARASAGIISLGFNGLAPVDAPAAVEASQGDTPAAVEASRISAEELPGPAQETSEIDALAGEIDQQREQVAALDADIVVQQLEIVRLRDLFTAPVASGRERRQAQVELAAAQSELSRLEAELAEAERLLEELTAAHEALTPVESAPLR